MSDQPVPTTQDTSHGSSNSSAKGKRPQTSAPMMAGMTNESMLSKNEVTETLNSFLSRIAEAKILGHEWVETTPEIIAMVMRKNLGDSGYFIYQNIKVCETGKSEAIQARETESTDDKYNRSLGITVHGGRT